MRPIRTAILGLLALTATILAPGVAQASTVSHRTTTPAATPAAVLSGHLVHLRDGRTVYVRLGSQSAAPRPASGARTAASTYDHGYVEICNNAACSKWTVEIVYNVTYNGSNVWVNGWPKCYQYGTQIDQCTYWDNGQSVLYLGVNFGPSYLDAMQVSVDAYGDCNGYGNIGVTVKESCFG